MTAQFTCVERAAATARFDPKLTHVQSSRSGRRQDQMRYWWPSDTGPVAQRRMNSPRARALGSRISCHVTVTFATALNTFGAASPAVMAMEHAACRGVRS